MNFWEDICFEKSSNTASFWRSDKNLLLVCVIEFCCSKRRHWVTCRFHSFRGVCRDTILCRLVFVGDLWRDEKEHLVLASLRNGDFQNRLFACVRFRFKRSLMTTILSGTCLTASFWFPHKALGISFRITGQSYISPAQPAYSFHLELSSQNGEKETTTKSFCNYFGSWTPN